MKIDKALKLAIDSLVREKQSIAWDANLVRATGDGSPVMKKRAERFGELEEAILELRRLRAEVGER
jgi:hypothetical protein